MEKIACPLCDEENCVVLELKLSCYNEMKCEPMEHF